MSLLYLKEIHDGRDGDDENTGKKDVRRYTRVFRARTSSAYDGAGVVLAGAPRKGAAYPYDSQAKLQKRVARNEGFSKYVWIVTLSYSTEKELEENPLSDPAEIEWETTETSEPFQVDKDGDAITNSAGDPYMDPPVMGDNLSWVCVVKKNVVGVPEWLVNWGDGPKPINSTAVVIDGRSWPAQTLRFEHLTLGKQEKRNDIPYRVLTYKLAYRKATWVSKPLDRGLRMINPMNPDTLIKITDEDGDPVTKPVFMDGYGLPLGTLDDGREPVARTVEIYPEYDFNLLPRT